MWLPLLNSEFSYAFCPTKNFLIFFFALITLKKLSQFKLFSGIPVFQLGDTILNIRESVALLGAVSTGSKQLLLTSTCESQILWI